MIAGTFYPDPKCGRTFAKSIDQGSPKALSCGEDPIANRPRAAYAAAEFANTMNIRQKFLLSLATLVCALFVTGCNTMRGLGQDTERAGEKIQEKATR